MKLERTLTIGRQTYPVIAERVILALSQAGRAVFTLQSNGDSFTRNQPVAFSIGYNTHEAASQLFLGYVDTVTEVDNRRVTLFCRELANVLEAPAPISLRHPTVSDVLAELSQTTALKFFTHDNGAKIPNFYNASDGYHALTAIGTLFKLDDFVWQQQGNGVIYAGQWADSRWADKAIDIGGAFLSEQTSTSAKVAAIPTLRPGVVVNGKRVKRVDFSSNHMTLDW